ncbi:MAG: hypothetical protein GYA51_09065 [Candidatus Methanofastidiosa archaeon]|nr:hypothetical protein [Candidatus Methanofastidiosa archaeon]
MLKKDFFDDLPDELNDRYRNLISQLISLGEVNWNKPLNRKRIKKIAENLERKANIEFEMRLLLLEALRIKKGKKVK